MKPYAKPCIISVRLTPEERDRLVVLAQEDGRTVCGYVRHAMIKPALEKSALETKPNG